MKTYLDTTGVEFSHVGNLEQEEWLYEHYEKHMLENIAEDLKVHIAKGIIKS